MSKYEVQFSVVVNGKKRAEKLSQAIRKLLKDQFQNIEETWLTVDRVYETRYDCKIERLAAV